MSVINTYFGLGKEQVAIFIQHGLGPLEELRGDPLKFIIHCGWSKTLL